MSGGLFGFGQRMLLDAHQNFVRSGLRVYLRVNNFEEPLEEGTETTAPDYIEVGMPYSPTGAASVETGYVDIPVVPPPNVQDVSLQNIGYFGGRLNFGSRIFTISHTFVKQQMNELGITDPYEVWRDRGGKKAIGIIYQDRTFAIESITHREVGGETISWRLVCNALEGANSAPPTG
jgi:hypothetical protein